MSNKPTYKELEQRIRELEQVESDHKQEKNMSKKERDFISNVLYWIDSLVVVIDINGYIISFNRASEQLSGYRFEELQGRPFWEILLVSDEREGVKETIKDVHIKKLPKDFQNQWVTKTGEKRLIHWNNSILKKADGSIEYILCTGLDITERQKAEESLKESEENYRILFDNAPDLIVLIDTEGNFLDINKKFEEESGYSREELIQTNAFTNGILTESSVNRTIPHFEELLAGKKWVLLEVEGVTKGGSKNPYELTAVPITKDSKVVAVLATLRDLTERKQLERKLQQSQKLESIGTLAGGIAHDFNNILSPVMGYTELLLREVPEESPLRIYLNEVLKGALRARDLVKQILAFGRQTDQEIKPLKVQHLLKEVLELSRSTLPTTIQIKQDIYKECGMIMADPTQVHQVVMNLITNAFHAMEDTGGNLTVGLNEIDLTHDNLPELNITPGPYVCLTVADTGTGMNDETLERLFEPYFSTKERDKGTGIGLAVVHGIVSTYSGAVVVESELGKGTEFKVFIPRIVSEVVETKTETQPIALLTGNERILLVDDEEPISMMIKTMLERLGYQVSVRNSSTDTLKAFRAVPDRFDLVITDMTMPNLTGDKLAIEIKKIRPDIPIILCTGFSAKVSEGKSSDFGIDGVLMKPVALVELAKALRNVLDRTD